MTRCIVLRDIVPVQVVMEIQNPQARYERHVEASDECFLFCREIRVVQHCNVIEKCLRSFVFDVVRERLLLLAFVIGKSSLQAAEFLQVAAS